MVSLILFPKNVYTKRKLGSPTDFLIDLSGFKTENS